MLSPRAYQNTAARNESEVCDRSNLAIAGSDAPQFKTDGLVAFDRPRPLRPATRDRLDDDCANLGGLAEPGLHDLAMAAAGALEPAQVVARLAIRLDACQRAVAAPHREHRDRHASSALTEGYGDACATGMRGAASRQPEHEKHDHRQDEAERTNHVDRIEADARAAHAHSLAVAPRVVIHA